MPLTQAEAQELAALEAESQAGSGGTLDDLHALQGRMGGNPLTGPSSPMFSSLRENSRGLGGILGTLAGMPAGPLGSIAGAGIGSAGEDVIRGEPVGKLRALLSMLLAGGPSAAAGGINLASKLRPSWMGRTADATRIGQAAVESVPQLGPPQGGPLPPGPAGLADIAGKPGDARLSAFLGAERDAIAQNLPTTGAYPPRPFLPNIANTGGEVPGLLPRTDPIGAKLSLSPGSSRAPVSPFSGGEVVSPGVPSNPQEQFLALMKELVDANKQGWSSQGIARDSLTGAQAGRESGVIRQDIINLLDPINPSLASRFKESQGLFNRGSEIQRALKPEGVLGTQGFDQEAMQKAVNQRLKEGGNYDPAVLKALFRGGVPPIGDRSFTIPRTPIGMTYKAGPGANMQADPLMRLLGPLIQMLSRQGGP